MADPIILETIAALRAWREDRRRAGARVGLVPTMGALHQGHISLVRGIAKVTDAQVVSIFVNPTQFSPNEDFSKYPRTFRDDLNLLSEIGTEAVFAPQVTEIYAGGFATEIVPGGPAKVGLEDAFRPTHFTGVATVVTKLLLQCLPDAAIFGEKDYQQLAVIRRTTRDLDIPVEIMGGPTMRDPDGLAMSSRNIYLTPNERMIAPMVYQVLKDTLAAVGKGTSLSELERRASERLTVTGFAVDYVAIRDAASLAEPAPNAAADSLRFLVAAKLGKTRLIDNIGRN
jgi:pantoate--beta-alanine ligase